MDNSYNFNIYGKCSVEKMLGFHYFHIITSEASSISKLTI